jgi:hypothetical protein
LVGDPLQRLTDTLTKFLSYRERAGFSGRSGRLAVSLPLAVTRVAAGCGVEACPGLERGLVRVTLDDGGHRYSQRKQLMSDHSHDQLTVPDDLHDQRSIPDGLHYEPITHDDPIDCDFESSLSFDVESHDRLCRHTHLQPVAQTQNGGVWC